MHTKSVDARTLAGTGHAADADTNRVAAVGQTLLNHFLCHDLMLRQCAFHQRDRLAQSRHIAFQDAADILINSKKHLPMLAHPRQPGVHRRRLSHTGIHLQSGKFISVFRVFHLRNAILTL